MGLDAEGFDFLIDAPSYDVHERRCRCALWRLQVPELTARLVALRAVSYLTYGAEVGESNAPQSSVLASAVFVSFFFVLEKRILRAYIFVLLGF